MSFLVFFCVHDAAATHGQYLAFRNQSINIRARTQAETVCTNTI